MKLDIQFDLDGIIIQYAIWLEKFLGNRFYKIIHNGKFNFDVEPKISNNKFHRLIYKAMDYIDKIETYPGAHYTLEALHQTTGEPIRIITHRPLIKAEQTYAVVKKALMDIPFSISLTGGDKGPYITSRCYIDDRRKNVVSLANQGFTVFMPEREYNMPLFDSLQNIPVWHMNDWTPKFMPNPTRTGRIIIINEIEDILDYKFRDLIVS